MNNFPFCLGKIPRWGKREYERVTPSPARILFKGTFAWKGVKVGVARKFCLARKCLSRERGGWGPLRKRVSTQTDRQKKDASSFQGLQLTAVVAAVVAAVAAAIVVAVVFVVAAFGVVSAAVDAVFAVIAVAAVVVAVATKGRKRGRWGKARRGKSATSLSTTITFTCFFKSSKSKFNPTSKSFFTPVTCIIKLQLS